MARMVTSYGTDPVTIRSFQDVIDNGCQVVTVADSALQELLRTAGEGTAMHAVYHGEMRNNPDQGAIQHCGDMACTSPPPPGGEANFHYNIKSCHPPRHRQIAQTK